jgi:nucleoside-diphosphate-sugar epimerase
MRIFITGASGYIGNAVAKAFRRSGHQVFGLVRSESKAQNLRAEEIIPVIGLLENPTTYLEEAKKAEVLIHCAFEASSSSVPRDLQTIETLLEAANSSFLPRIIIYTSGVWVYGNTGNDFVDEAAPLNPLNLVKWRPAHEEKILKSAHDLLKPIVIRPGCVYGKSGGLTSIWFSSAVQGALTIVGNGQNTWSMVHIDDLAEAYVLAAEKELNCITLSINDGRNPLIKQIAEEIAKAVDFPSKIRFLSYEEAFKQFGPVAEGLIVNQKVKNERAMRLLGWRPRHPAFVDAVKDYYEAWKAAPHNS